MEDVEICNSALGWVESGERLTSLDDNSESGRVCKQHYDRLRKRLLRSHPWAWATVTKKLVKADYDHPEWSFSYEYPEDYLLILRIQRRDSSEEVVYAVEGVMDGDGLKKMIFSNEEDIYARGTFDIKEGFDSSFIDYFALSLAQNIAVQLDASQGVRDRISLYRIELMREAMAVDSSQAKVPDMLPKWLRDGGYSL